MTAERDVERVLERWLVDGIDEMPDRVYLSILDRVERQPQRRAWRVSWRDSSMNAHLKPILAIAAVLVLAVGGIALVARPFGSSAGGIASPPSPSPLPSVAPSPSPSGTPPPMPEGVLSAGTYTAQPVPYASPLRATFTVPAGWQGFGGWAILGPDRTDPPGGIGIALVTASGLLADPCTSVGAGQSPVPVESIGPTVDDLVAALTAHAGYTASSPTDITFGGYAGKQLDLQLPHDLGGCIDDNTKYYIWEENGAEGLFAQGPANIWQLKVVDVDGLRLIVVVTSYAETPGSVKAEAQSILDSMVLEP